MSLFLRISCYGMLLFIRISQTDKILRQKSIKIINENLSEKSLRKQHPHIKMSLTLNDSKIRRCNTNATEELFVFQNFD